ncbi:MAG TPA: cytochrome c [Sphingobium sp.]
MKMRAMFLLSTLALGVASVTAAAAALSPQQAVDARKSRYREMGAAFKTINDQVKSGTLVKVTLRGAARNIAGAARDQWQWFPTGAGPQAGFKTKAKANIWSDAAGFKKAQAAFQQQADLMTKAVEGGQLSEVQKQAKALGQTCAACHRAYREED